MSTRIIARTTTLECIYQNDIFYVDRESQLSAYADDHQLYFSHEKPELVIQKINTDGKNTPEWYKENFLEGNITKYQTMIIPKQETHELDVEIDGITIKASDELKLLGVTIDRNLTFSEHISTVCKKASSRVGVLMHLRKLIPVKAKLRIYKAAILPYLTYCGLIWHFCKKSDSNKLEKINERGLRAVYNDWNTTYSELLVRAKMTNLYNRRLQDIAILMFKVKNKLLPRNILHIFIDNGNNYNLRNADFTLPRINTIRFGKHSIRYYGPFLWSKLPSTTRNYTMFAPFKNNIRKHNLTELVDRACPPSCLLCNM